MAQRFAYPVKFDQSNSTGLKNSLIRHKKTNVKPDMATYSFNSMLYKFLITNYAWHNDLPTRSNSTGLKNSFKMAQKTKVEPDMATYWFNSMLYKFLIKIMRGTMIYLPSRIRPASKTALKRHKKPKLSLIWLHTGSIVCCTSF